MKTSKCILLIDDKDQSAVMRDIKYTVASTFDVEFLFIRTARPDLKKDDSEDVDPAKVEQEIRRLIDNKSVDFALTDFDLNNQNLDGLDIISMVHELRPNLKFLVYSGNWDKVIRKVISVNYQDASTEDIVNGVNRLIHNNIVDCIGRGEYKEELIKYLNRATYVSMEHRLVKLLRSNKDMTFQSCYPEFKGKTFGEIADIIEKRSDSRADEWIESILSQTIAYLVSVNHE